jgi:hypothetical protein
MATTQRERNAAQAREKMEARRDDADGAAGWVAERAGQWNLEGVDDTFMGRQKYLWNPLMDYWFRMEIEGWEHLSELPLPTKIRTAFQPPVKLSRDPAKAKDEKYVDRKYDEVQQSLQDGMDALARRRTFPVFG